MRKFGGLLRVSDQTTIKVALFESGLFPQAEAGHRWFEITEDKYYELRATKYSVVIQESDGCVVGCRSAQGPYIPPPQNPATHTNIEITKAVYDAFNGPESSTVPGSGALAWRRNAAGTGIERIPDKRKEIEFDPPELVVPAGPAGAQGFPVLTVRMLKADGTVNASYNSTDRLTLASGHDLSLEFKRGVATIEINTTKPFRATSGGSRQFRVKGGVDIRVLATQLGPRGR